MYLDSNERKQLSSYIFKCHMCCQLIVLVDGNKTIKTLNCSFDKRKQDIIDMWKSLRGCHNNQLGLLSHDLIAYLVPFIEASEKLPGDQVQIGTWVDGKFI